MLLLLPDEEKGRVTGESLMEQNVCGNYVAILRNELVPVLGRIEPVAIAYAAAKGTTALNTSNALYDKRSIKEKLNSMGPEFWLQALLWDPVP